MEQQGQQQQAGSQAADQQQSQQQQSSQSQSGQQSQSTHSADWTQGLDENSRGYVQNKGWKSPNELLESYQNFEKLHGVPKERLLKLPEKEDAPEWNEIYERLGKPKDAKDYNLKMPEKHGDQKFMDWSRQKFHELGLTKKQAEKLSNEWNQYQGQRMAENETAYQNNLQKQEMELKSKWGAAHEQNINIAKRAVEGLGIKPEMIDQLEMAMGFSGVIELFHNIGSRTGEHSFHSGGNNGGGPNVLTPDAARNEIARLRSDTEFIKKYATGDSESKAKMERLHKQAYPDDIQTAGTGRASAF